MTPERRVAMAVLIGFAVSSLIVPAVAGAQTAASSIAGTVKDTTGALLPGVTVEASSPALIEKVRSVVTDGDGRYQISELRPGTYSVTFTLAGFNALKREGIELTTGFTASVNAELQVGDVSETVTVSGESPVVDLQNTKQVLVLTRGILDSLPSAGRYQSLGVMVPGVMIGASRSTNASQDVGGANGMSYSGLSVHGGRQNDGQLQIDGFPIIGWSSIFQASMTIVNENFQEIALDVAANPAETEAGGVRMNLIPKEGANIFNGRTSANISGRKFQGSNITDQLRSQGLLDGDHVKRMWRGNFSYGGPIMTSKLWFFATGTHMISDAYKAGQYLNSSPAAWTYVPDLTQQAVHDTWDRDVAVRLTWQATPRNKIAAYLDKNYNCDCHQRLGESASREENVGHNNRDNAVYQVKWTMTASNRLLFDAGASLALQHQNFKPQTRGGIAPPITDSGLAIVYRGGTVNFNNFKTPTSRGTMSYVTGTHALKVGYTLVMGEARQLTSEDTGNVAFAALNGTPTQVTYRATPYLTLNNVFILGIYGQDQWILKRLTLNAGVRSDYYRPSYPDQSVPPTQFVPLARSVTGQVAVRWKDLSPRFGVSYDLFGTGKTALKATASRYVYADGTNRANDINPINTNNANARRWTDANNDRIVQGDPFNNATNGELGPSTNLSFGKPLATLRYDPQLISGFGVRPYNWEFSTSIQHELRPNLSVTAAYFRRIYGNFLVTDNLLAAPSDYDPYCVTAPLDSRLPGGGGQQICGLFDLKPSKVGLVDSVVTRASNYGAQYEHWNGLDLTVNARLPNLTMQGGLNTGRTIADNCAVVVKLDNPSTVSVPAIVSSAFGSTSPTACHIETPFLTQVKILASTQLPGELQLSGTYQNIPGLEIAANATFTNAQITPSLGRSLSSGSTVSVNLVDVGALYGDRVNQVDLRLARTFKIGRTRLQGMLDLYNLLNASPVTAITHTYGATTGAAVGSAWLIPQATLQARFIKLGVQLDF